jgi:hypothetical protein
MPFLKRDLKDRKLAGRQKRFPRIKYLSFTQLTRSISQGKLSWINPTSQHDFLGNSLIFTQKILLFNDSR